MTTAITIFAVQLAYVFLLGFQSRNVRDGQYLAAAMTSTCLGMSGIYVQPMLVKAAIINPSPFVLVAYVAAGPIGICSAMWIHDKFSKRSDG